MLFRLSGYTLCPCMYDNICRETRSVYSLTECRSLLMTDDTLSEIVLISELPFRISDVMFSASDSAEFSCEYRIAPIS